MIFHVFRTDLSATWGHQPPPATAAKFRSQLDRRLAEEGIRLDGDGPLFTDDEGKVLNIANLFDRCVKERHTKWSGYIDDFAHTTSLLTNLEDPLAMSADVVRASLRLRLVDDTAVNGWKIHDQQHDQPQNEPPQTSPTASIFEAYDEVSASILSRPAMPGARWNLYVQRPGAGHGVVADHLERWGIDQAEAFEIARDHAELAKPATRARRFGTFWESGHSMFTHNRILFPERVAPKAVHGWFIAAPTRSDVFVAPALPDSTGFSRLGHVLKASRELWATDTYPASRHCWYVPPSGIGRFGCDAEAIVLTDESLPGERQPDVRVRFGDQLHTLFGELTPGRPAPRRVI